MYRKGRLAYRKTRSTGSPGERTGKPESGRKVSASHQAQIVYGKARSREATIQRCARCVVSGKTVAAFRRDEGVYTKGR
jgi:hypothetical protein